MIKITTASKVSVCLAAALTTHMGVLAAISSSGNSDKILIEGGAMSVKFGGDTSYLAQKAAPKIEPVSPEPIADTPTPPPEPNKLNSQPAKPAPLKKPLPIPQKKQPALKKVVDKPLDPKPTVTPSPAPTPVPQERMVDPHPSTPVSHTKSQHTHPQTTKNHAQSSTPHHSNEADAGANKYSHAGDRQTRTNIQKTGKSTAPGNSTQSNYRGLVMRKLLRVRRPRASGPGSAYVSFELNNQGELVSVSISKGSGSSRFDRDALKVVKRAAPFPEPPKNVNLHFTVEIKGR